MITLSYVEFYSGIGGWGYALENACQSIGRASSAKMKHEQKKPKLTNRIADRDDGTRVHSLNITAQLLAAYDHSDLCNSVFMHNHTNYDDSTKKSFKPRQTPIEKITQKELESHAATIWCMSPPCQPHTRQHSNQYNERDDPRSKSFLHLCNMLSIIDEDKLPCLILLENVVGFESFWGGSSLDFEKTTSNTNSSISSYETSRGSFAEWRRVLSLRQYEVAHFHLDPIHVGLPNNRPRYYCIAYRRNSLKKRLAKDLFNNDQSEFLSNTVMLDRIFSRENLNQKPVIHNETSLADFNNCESNIISQIKEFLDLDLKSGTNTTDQDHLQMEKKKQQLLIPQKVQTSSSSWCFDIITPHHKCSSCFTHSYGKFIKGTGSILYDGPLRFDDEDGKDKRIPSIDKFRLSSPEERNFDRNWSKDINWDYMRYLSGTEIARLMGFPMLGPVGDEHELSGHTRTFSFPSNCTMRQQWKLLGNSLNVQVAARVAVIGIRGILNDMV